MSKQVIKTPKAPMGKIPLTQAIKAGGFIFCSGALGLDPSVYPKEMRIPPGGVRAEMKQILENLKAVLEEAGSSIDKVVKVTFYATNLKEDFDGFNEVFYQYFPLETSPARTTVEVSRLALPEARLEVDAIALA